MRQPKPKHFTAEQEAELTQCENQMLRARIMQEGVKVVLGDGEYCDSMQVCAHVLAEAHAMRQDAYNRRSQIMNEPKIATAGNPIRRRS